MTCRVISIFGKLKFYEKKSFYMYLFSIHIHRVSPPVNIKDQTVYEMCLRTWRSLLALSNAVLELMILVSHVGKVFALVSLHMRR